MATKCFCDSCGAEGAGRVVLSVARSSPLQMIGDGKDMDADLCQPCFDKFLAAVRAVKIIPVTMRQMLNQK